MYVMYVCMYVCMYIGTNLLGICGCGRHLLRGHDGGGQLGRFGGLVVGLHHLIHLCMYVMFMYVYVSILGKK